MALSSKICLVILDGWGIGEEGFFNAIAQAKIPNIDEIKKWYPLTNLQTSGIAVGLPPNTAGNSEVGHLTIGTGQIIYQYPVRISQSIKNKTFFQNPAWIEVLNHLKTTQGTLHLIGLLSEAIVHSSYEHLLALLELAKMHNINKVYLHLFTDGRDSSPVRAKSLLSQLIQDLQDRGIGQIATLSGRFYGMDRDKNYQRTAKVYDALTIGKGNIIENPLDYLSQCYANNITDEFIPPAIIKNNTDDLPIIRDGDGIIFFNFREERMKQLTEAFVIENFQAFPIKKFTNLKIALMTQYDDSFKVPVAFPPQIITTCLAKVLSENKLRQLHLAESEKYAHVTYFFDGLKETPFDGEHWVIIPSLKTLHLEDYPELMARTITTRLLQAFNENVYDFILVNYANADLIGHTGNLEAGIKCAEILDEEIGKILKAAPEHNYTLIITADHGNLEQMKNPVTGEVDTEHNVNPAPLYLIDPKWKLTIPRTLNEIKEKERALGGMIVDIAPTVLELFGLIPPPIMTGQSLLPLLGIFPPTK